MTARTHDIVAFASLITIAVLRPPESLNIATAGASLIGVIVGSLLPDIDQASNDLWKLTPISGLTGQIMRRLFISHRALSHSLIGVVLFYKILDIILPLLLNPANIDHKIVLGSIMIGYISHLVADSLTRGGLPLLFPLKLRVGIPPIKEMRIKTGSFFETFVVFPGVLVYIFWFLLNHQTEAIQILRLVRQ